MSEITRKQLADAKLTWFTFGVAAGILVSILGALMAP